MLKKRTLTLAVIIAVFMMLSFVNSSNAQILIIDMSISSEIYDYGYIYDSAYIETDEPYDIIYWYIGDPDDPNGNYQYVGETLGDGVKTRAWFYPDVSDCPGHIKGEKYRIGALADYYNEEEEAWWDDWESRDFKVYKKISLSRQGPKTGAWGYVGISKFYYNGSHIIMDSYAYASNPRNNPKARDPNNNPLIVAPWFWTQKYTAPNGSPEDERRDTKDSEIIAVGKTSQYFTPGPDTDPHPRTGERKPFDRFIGTLERDDAVYYKAHTHLQVTAGNKVDDWEVDTQQQTGTAAVTFTWEDGP